MTEIGTHACPHDTVRLNGIKPARVVDWDTKRPFFQKSYAATHYAVQPIDAHGRDVGDVQFWPINGMEIVQRHIAPSIVAS